MRGQMGAYAAPEGGGGELTTAEQAWAKIDELQYKFQQMIDQRLALYNAIKAMPLGQERDSLANEFNEIENSLVMQYVIPGVNYVFGLLGYQPQNTSLPGTLGFLPALWAAFAAASWGTQVIAATAAVALIAYVVEVLAKYSAMAVRPSLAPSLASSPSISGTINETVKLVSYGALAMLAAYLFLPKLLGKKV